MQSGLDVNKGHTDYIGTFGEVHEFSNRAWYNNKYGVDVKDKSNLFRSVWVCQMFANVHFAMTKSTVGFTF